MVEDYPKLSTIHVMLNEIRLGGFKWDIARNTQKTLTTMIEKARKHTMAENIVFLEDNCEVRDLYR